MSTETADLRPHESITLTVALAFIDRGEELPPNMATVCALALGRLTGRVDYDSEEGAYSIRPRVAAGVSGSPTGDGEQR